MWWECSECGFLVEAERCPVHCDACGTAGGIFVEAERGLELDPDFETFREAWTYRGMEQTSIV